MDNNDKRVTAKAGKYLIFSIAGEKYGIDILKVKEIIGVINITKVPGTPEYIMGVINLRGKIIPTIDLRMKIGFEYREYDDRTCIIIVEIEGIMVGVIVDRVEEVINIEEDNLDTFPEFGLKILLRSLWEIMSLFKEPLTKNII
jgi:purine-binding chemotaxis protein CheW